MAARFISRQFLATALLSTAMSWTAALLCSHTASAQASHGSLADRLKAVQSGQPDGKGPALLPAWKPVTPGASAPAIPVVKGLQVVTAITQPIGDYESIKSVEDVDAVTVRLHYSDDMPTPKMGGLLGRRALPMPRVTTWSVCGWSTSSIWPRQTATANSSARTRWSISRTRPRSVP